MKSFQKIVTAKEMSRIEKCAIDAKESAENFMREAGKQVALETIDFVARHNLPQRVAILIGKGNNGGDGWVAGAWLKEEGFDVTAFPLFDPKQCSVLNQKMMHLFMEKKGRIEKEIHFDRDLVILDAMLGTGFQGKLDPQIERAIELANNSKNEILALDIPSGLDGETGETRGAVIRATETITLEFLKSGFFLGEGWNSVGKIVVKEFGLPLEWKEKAKSFALMPKEKDLRELLPPILRNRHKYQAGYVLGFGGSKALPGAIKLTGLSALRSGAGIVRIFSLEEIGEMPYELIFNLWNEKEWEKELKRAQAVFVGPGLGSSKGAIHWLKKRLSRIDKNCVIDADALQFDIPFPKNSILTPHRGEVLRLLNLKKNPSEEKLLDLCQAFCKKHAIILVLKGAPTFILTAAERFVIPYGDPGMATAGSGDVLTGILASLLAQGLPPLKAAILGVSLHGMTGEAISEEKGSYGFLASDLIHNLYRAFQRLM